MRVRSWLSTSTSLIATRNDVAGVAIEKFPFEAVQRKKSDDGLDQVLPYYGQALAVAGIATYHVASITSALIRLPMRASVVIRS